MSTRDTDEELPIGWKRASLGEYVTNSTIRADLQTFPNSKFLGMDCILPNSMVPHRWYQFRDFKSSGLYFLEGQVLYGRMRPYLNKVYKAEFEGVCSGEFLVLDCLPDLLPDYLKFLLHSKRFVEWVSKKTNGDRPRVSFDDISSFEISLPPISVQYKIIGKVEEQLSLLLDAKYRLEATKEQLFVYRKTILLLAFQGKLTNPKSSNRELPIGWRWSTTGEVINTISNGQTPANENLKQGNGEIPFIKVYNLNFDGTLNFKKNPTFIPSEIHRGGLKRSVCLPDDVLTNIVGPPLGKVSIVPNDYEEWNINQAIVLFRPNENIISKFLSYFLQNPTTIDWLGKTSKGTAGQFNIKLSTCRRIPIPVPSIAEQEAVIKAIETRLSAIDSLNHVIQQNLIGIEQLHQSIIDHALHGRSREGLLKVKKNNALVTAALAEVNYRRERTREIDEKRSTMKAKARLDSAIPLQQKVMDIIEREFRGNEFEFADLDQKLVCHYEDLRDIIFDLIENQNRIALVYSEGSGRIKMKEVAS